MKSSTLFILSLILIGVSLVDSTALEHTFIGLGLFFAFIAYKFA